MKIDKVKQARVFPSFDVKGSACGVSIESLYICGGGYVVTPSMQSILAGILQMNYARLCVIALAPFSTVSRGIIRCHCKDAMAGLSLAMSSVVAFRRVCHSSYQNDYLDACIIKIFGALDATYSTDIMTLVLPECVKARVSTV